MVLLLCYEDTLQNMVKVNGYALKRFQSHEFLTTKVAHLKFRIDLIVYKQNHVMYGKDSFHGASLPGRGFNGRRLLREVIGTTKDGGSSLSNAT